MLSVIEVT